MNLEVTVLCLERWLGMNLEVTRLCLECWLSMNLEVTRLCLECMNCFAIPFEDQSPLGLHPIHR